MRGIALALSLAFLASPAVARAETPGPKKSRDWSFAAYVDGYLRPDESAYLAPTLFADRNPLHIEARYNYEDFDTVSLFVGWTFAIGKGEDYLKLTPMLGGVAGGSDGVAPGVEIEARWSRLAYWLEAEYFFDLGDSSEDFLYTWSEVNLYLLDYLWAGGSLQRLKLVRTPTEVDVGPMVGAAWPGAPGASLSLYFYGLGASTRWYLATIAFQF